MTRTFTRLALLGLLLATGCTKVYNESPVAPTPDDPTTPPAIVTHLVELRVTGTVTSIVTITSSNTTEGLDVVDSGVPWFRQFKITRDTFVFLGADCPGGTGLLHVQVFIDGVLFREAVGNGVSPKVSVSGTYTTSGTLGRVHP